ncbi:zinc-binding alcohol dehydrogenase [Microbacterium oleivorans]|uniref:Zinc-binding alcohol dehydrogenase n=1 Tax=Microbacterium oleivorans TaxID=273677 RepID=A0A7D5JF89_9MICO|nr:zinc-binding alcohol dehydrogenase [Microbacterium oleivorans]QLD11738.1 zinc-binding alcohol dehydrogenase [Microbacterium oleivorans]
MNAAGTPEWVVREDAAPPAVVALYLRQVLGVRSPDELPHLRGVEAAPPERPADEQIELERQWRAYWAMTVEPLAHPSPVPLDLVAGYDTLVALPTEGFALLEREMLPHAAAAVSFAREVQARYAARTEASGGVAYRAYAGALAQHERRVGRRAHSFELNVQVLPLAQRGVWWIGSLTIAVTDGLRSDIVAFDAAIAPIIAEIA